MDHSIFMDKSVIPTQDELKNALGQTWPFWSQIREYVYEIYPDGVEEWNFPGKNYGWSFRIKDKKRAILYLLPRDQFFYVAFVFGHKATDKVLKSQVSEKIKTDLESARVYAEGRGVKIEVKNQSDINDIKSLVDIKMDKV